MTFYLLSTERTHYFSGPDDLSEKEFKRLCLSLLDEAASIALTAAKENKVPVAWSSVTAELPALLAKHGFKEVNPPTVFVPMFDMRHPASSPGDAIMPRMAKTLWEYNRVILEELSRNLSDDEDNRQARELLANPARMEKSRKILAMADKLAKDKV